MADPMRIELTEERLAGLSAATRQFLEEELGLESSPFQTRTIGCVAE